MYYLRCNRHSKMFEWAHSSLPRKFSITTDNPFYIYTWTLKVGTYRWYFMCRDVLGWHHWVYTLDFDPWNNSRILESFFKHFMFRERGREWKRGRETSMCGCLSHALCWGPGLQLRHVPWLGIIPATLWFTGWCSIHWATPARAVMDF